LNRHLKNRRKIIGIGSKRIVYDLGGGYVLKVARTKSGIRSNKTEILMYKSRRSARIRKYLAPITKYGHRWLIMKKYSRKFRLTKKYMRKYRRLNSRIRRKGIVPYDIYSMTHKRPSLTNLRLNRHGRIVIIDYGNFKFRRWKR
jgi:hypothetical protein